MLLAKWCETTSCSGIINLYEARKNKPLFIFWAILMLSMTLASIFFTYKTIKGYVDSPYATNIETITNAEFLVPDIAICYNGGVNVSAMKEANFSDDFIYRFLYSQRVGTLYYNGTNFIIDEARLQLLSYMNEKEISRGAIYDHFMFTCEELMDEYHCMNYTKRVLGIGRSCFSYENYFTQRTVLDGVEFRLHSPRTSYANSYAKEGDAMDITKDFIVIIEKSLDSISLGRGYRIPINYRVEIVLYPKFYKRIFDERCEPNATANPTSTSCSRRCYEKEIAKACKCSRVNNLGIDGINDTEICLPFQVCDVVDYTLLTKCASECLQKCEQWNYDPMITFSPIDSMVADNYSNVFIYYENLQYQKIEEIESFTYDMAIANVGGQCGLWLGASIVTFIEVLYYLVLMLTNKFTVSSTTKKADELKTDHVSCEKMIKEQNRVIQLLADEIKSFKETLRKE